MHKIRIFLLKNIFVLVPIVYLLTAVMSLSSIGIGWDTPVNLFKGEQVYNFLRTLNTNYLLDDYYRTSVFSSVYFNEIPSYENGHPPAYSFFSFTIGHLFSQIFGFKYYFFHVLNIILTSVFIYFFQKFLYRYTKNYTFSLLAAYLLISVPHFYIYTLVNTKDLPVVIFPFISIYLLSQKTQKPLKTILLVFIFMLISIYSKFTSIYLLPIVLYLFYKNRVVRGYLFRNYISTTMYILCTFVFFTFFTWPHLLFNFWYELDRIKFVYFLLPSESSNSYFFTYYLVQKLPILYFVVLLISFAYSIFISRYKKMVAFWTLPTVLYLILVNKYYEFFRQFLFFLIPLFFTFALLFSNFFKKFNFMYLKIVSIFILTIYASFYLFMPTYNKIFFSSILFNEGSKDVWGLSLPTALDYVYSHYPQEKVYFSPLAFLLEYYDVRQRGYEIIYNPADANIWIVTSKVAAYEEERALRESSYYKDTNFRKGSDVLEIWVKKTNK